MVFLKVSLKEVSSDLRVLKGREHCTIKAVYKRHYGVQTNVDLIHRSFLER
jgi:hypothetical protein